MQVKAAKIPPLAGLAIDKQDTGNGGHSSQFLLCLPPAGANHQCIKHACFQMI